MSENSPATPNNPNDAPEMRPCPNFGRMTSTLANFCWWCARELSARPERPEPESLSSKIHLPPWVWTALGILFVLTLILYTILR